MKQIQVRISGLSSLLMHSDRLANPLDPATKLHKQLTSKKTKTDDDHEAIAKSEWMSSLYIDDKRGPFVPTQNFKSALVQAGKLKKKGADFKRAAEIVEDQAFLQYKGPRTADGLYADRSYIDCRSVVISGKRLMRYRPIFREWSFEATVAFDEKMINQDAIEAALQDAGQFIGIGDFRPEKGGKFGRFTAQVL